MESKLPSSEGQVEAQVDLDILFACSVQPISSEEIAAALGHKKLSGNIRKVLTRLKDADLLASTIPDKPNSRLQKYRLTERGRAVLEEDASLVETAYLMRSPKNAERLTEAIARLSPKPPDELNKCPLRKM